MDKKGYEERLGKLEMQLELIKERCRILEETTSALLFEYDPRKDEMIFLFNFPDNKSRKVIENYSEYIKRSQSVHSDQLKNLLEVLKEASACPVSKELTYLGKTGSGEYQWHKVTYTSLAGETGGVIRVLGKIRNIHKSVIESQDIVRKLETDFLTGLYNKGTATEKISVWLKDNPDRQAHMIMLDLDDFKGINDTYGHSFGDEVLKETAKVMSESFSQSSILSRFGGDEFIIFVMDESLKEVEDRIDVMMRKMAEEITGMEWPLHCSVGVTARISPDDDFEELFNRADNVMYVAKTKGKNRYFVDRRHTPRRLRHAESLPEKSSES